MHYQNGREVKVGDNVIFKDYNGIVYSGVVVKANAQATTCNLLVAPVLMAGISNVTAGEAILAEDAFGACLPIPTLSSP